VAAGNPETAAAAAAVLRLGGNAVDAAIAAGFAAAVAEPGLTSLGGGGFLLLRRADGSQHLLDFFVNGPGSGRPASDLTPEFTPVTVAFSGAEQVFHAGYGSVGVPGVLDGYLTAHGRFGRLDLADVVAPARAAATDGVPLSPAQAEVLSLLRRIFTLTAEARAVFEEGPEEASPERGGAPMVGHLLRNAPYASFLGELAGSDVTGWRDRSETAALVEQMNDNHGLVTLADFHSYEVVERSPLQVRYRDATVTTNPAPSFGGAIVTDALLALDASGPLSGRPDGAVRVLQTLTAATESAKRQRRAQSQKGTTHISVADADGDTVSMTTSNGSCSGVMIPGTGVQLNNVMGEADLHPEGFHVTTPGTRISSMMAPMLLDLPDGSVVALGSGGSERIRSALTQAIVNLVDYGIDLQDAVDAARAHHDGNAIQVEPGLRGHELAALSAVARVNQWSAPNLYFGGVHAVMRGPDGTMVAAGDARRDGAGIVVEL